MSRSRLQLCVLAQSQRGLHMYTDIRTHTYVHIHNACKKLDKGSDRSQDLGLSLAVRKTLSLLPPRTYCAFGNNGASTIPWTNASEKNELGMYICTRPINRWHSRIAIQHSSWSLNRGEMELHVHTAATSPIGETQTHGSIGQDSGFVLVFAPSAFLTNVDEIETLVMQPQWLTR